MFFLRWPLLAAMLSLCTIGARGQTLETVLMPGKVIQGHAKYEAECKRCHVAFDKSAQAGLCRECHKETAQDVKAKRGYHGRLKDQDCRTCHTDHKGRNFQIAAFDKSKFDHMQTDFGLNNGHLGPKLKCDNCHKPGLKFREAPSACNDCHKRDDVHKGRLGTACADCHNDRDWKDARFDHDKTHFKLTGKHADVLCKDCHRDKEFKGAPRDCNGCHKTDDKHKGRYGPKCESCHVDRDWKDIRFNHDTATKYPLRGKHRQTKCDSCHRGVIQQEKLSQTCMACHHRDDVHKGGLGDKCESCHNERSWKNSSFDHDKDSKFPLKDKHKTAKCDACHKSGNYKEKLETTCVACHRADDDQKGHKGQFGVKCESCHSAKSWTTLIFSHSRDTRYPLRGRHERVKCTDCHKGTLYQEKFDSACIACHKKDDVHKNQLGAKCESCHSETSWKEAPFDHGKARFILAGAHFKVPCKDCHKTSAFKDAPSDCASCHDKDDVHKRRLGSKCESCHNARTWKAWDFDHDRRTAFPLDGGHKKAGCFGCHKKPVNAAKLETPSACVSCHADDDVHRAGFGAQCNRCHTSADWKAIRAGMGKGAK